MTPSKLASAVVVIAALAPVIASASPEKASVQACATAFAAKIAVPGYKLEYRGNFGSALADFYSVQYSFTMEARDPKTGSTIARAECSADAHGTVTSLTAIALDTKVALR
jgi:hypothetical protein